MFQKININKKTKLFPQILFLSDGIAVVLSFIFAYFLRDKGFFRIFLDNVQPLSVYLKVLPITVLLFIGTFSAVGLYEPKQRITKITELYTSIKAISIWILILMAGSYLSKKDYSRIILFLFYITTIVLVILTRLLIRKVQLLLNDSGFGLINILIVGTGRQANEIANRIERYSLAGYNLVGFVGNKTDMQEKVIGKVRNLNAVIKKYAVDEVYIANPTLTQNQILHIISSAPNEKVRFKITSNIFELITGTVDIANLESIPSLDVSRVTHPLWKSVYKRIFDIIFSLLAIAVTLPLWLTIIIIVKLSSSSSAIFTQKRIGYKGKPFLMYKFRTMKQNAKTYQKSPKNRNDGRITPIGKFLRSTSLDELPQFINILKGEMSIVGPRPEMPFIVKTYSRWERRRLSVKPGITGLWQILGRKDLPLSENLEYDFYYINNQSFILDIVIILKTIPLVILGKGAY